jgi:hypothetical protein
VSLPVSHAARPQCRHADVEVRERARGAEALVNDCIEPLTPLRQPNARPAGPGALHASDATRDLTQIITGGERTWPSRRLVARGFHRVKRGPEMSPLLSPRQRRSTDSSGKSRLSLSDLPSASESLRCVCEAIAVAWKAVRFDELRGVLLVGSGPDQRVIHSDGADAFIAHMDDLGSASATALKHALTTSGWTVLVADVPYASFDYEDSLGGPVAIGATDADLILEDTFELYDYHDDDVIHQRAERILRPLLRRSRCRFAGAELHQYSAATPWLATASLAPATRGRSTNEIYEIGVEAAALLSAASGGELTPGTTLDLLRAGHAQVLLGQLEGRWLDVKRQDYDLTNDKGKISLAQDVARFANADGGLVIVGFSTNKQRGGERIARVTPVPPPLSGMVRHARAVDNRVFPPVEGLTIEEVDAGSGVLIVINVPPQPEELKPFLVHGAIVNGKTEGAFISIVRRRGEESIPITPQSIHSTLAAGRALLRRGEVPGSG